jgi:hypothetical protein
MNIEYCVCTFLKKSSHIQLSTLLWQKCSFFPTERGGVGGGGGVGGWGVREEGSQPPH